MSLALSTLILFFLLIPGLVFRRFYYSEEFSREYFKETFFGVFISTLIPSILFQMVWYFMVMIFNHQVDLSVFGCIVSNNPKKACFENLESNALKILCYNMSMFVVSGFMGYFLKKLVRTRKWDRKYKFFRFQNSWHYILKGEFFDFPKAEVSLLKDTVEDIEFVFVDAIVEISGISYIYDGILVDYELSRVGGGLATISLTNAQRRKISDDSKIVKGKKEDNTEKYYPIKGHILVLKFSEIKNLNFTYYTLDKDDDHGEVFVPRLVG